MANEYLQALQSSASFIVKPMSEMVSKDSLRKLYLSPADKAHIESLAQQLPSLLAAKSMSGLYSVSFPDGLPHTLTALKQGGYGSMIMKNNSFVGSASFYNASLQASMFAAFSIMSVVTGQYFLTEINKDLGVINEKIDKILEFLYGDKRAELISEISFVRYAYECYNLITKNDDHRIATISSLQQSKKIAMKDIEFYLNDLESFCNAKTKDAQEMNDFYVASFAAYQNADLAIQLFALSNLLEAIYSQNLDPLYLSYLEKDVLDYISKYDKMASASFSALKIRIDEFRNQRAIDKYAMISEIDDTITKCLNGALTKKHKDILETFRKLSKPSEYIVSSDGNMYYEAS